MKIKKIFFLILASLITFQYSFSAAYFINSTPWHLDVKLNRIKRTDWWMLNLKPGERRKYPSLIDLYNFTIISYKGYDLNKLKSTLGNKNYTKLEKNNFIIKKGRRANRTGGVDEVAVKSHNQKVVVPGAFGKNIDITISKNQNTNEVEFKISQPY